MQEFIYIIYENEKNSIIGWLEYSSLACREIKICIFLMFEFSCYAAFRALQVIFIYQKFTPLEVTFQSHYSRFHSHHRFQSYPITLITELEGSFHS